MHYILALFTHTKTKDLLWFSGYALYLAFSFMVFHSVTVLSSAGQMDHGLEVLFLVATNGARIVVFVLVATFIRVVVKIPTIMFAALAITASVMGFVVTGMIFQFSDALTPELIAPWLAVGGVFLGIADTLTILLWAKFSATLTMRTVYLYIVLSNALSLVVYFLATLLPVWTALLVAFILFLVSALFGKKALDARPVYDYEYSTPVFKSAFRQLSHPVLGASILGFMSGLMLQISGQHEIPLTSFQQTSLITSAIAVALLLLPALLVSRPFNIARIYAVALPLSAAGFLLLPIIWNAAGGIVNSFAQLGSMVAGIILWCMLAETAHDTRLPSAMLFSVAMACINGSQLLGTVIGYFNADTLQHSDLALTAVALVAVYLLFMVALFLFKDKSFKGEEEAGREDVEIGGESIEVAFVERCDEVAALHSFTPRETEIFYHLAQGYTIPAMSEKLLVSENTIKSHVKSIYQKLDVHSRDEVIELVN